MVVHKSMKEASITEKSQNTRRVSGLLQFFCSNWNIHSRITKEHIIIIYYIFLWIRVERVTYVQIIVDRYIERRANSSK